MRGILCDDAVRRAASAALTMLAALALLVAGPPARAEDLLSARVSVEATMDAAALDETLGRLAAFGVERGFVLQIHTQAGGALGLMYRLDAMIMVLVPKPDARARVIVSIADGVHPADPAEVARLLTAATAVLAATPGAAVSPAERLADDAPADAAPAAPFAVVALTGAPADIDRALADVAAALEGSGLATEVRGTVATGVSAGMFASYVAVVAEAPPQPEAAGARATVRLAFHAGPLGPAAGEPLVDATIATARAVGGVDVRRE